MLSSLFPHRKFIRLDGGMGSMLQKGGMPVGALPEVYNITEPERIIDAQKQFVAVGSDIIYANTFGANRHKMAKSGYSVQPPASPAPGKPAPERRPRWRWTSARSDSCWNRWER